MAFEFFNNGPTIHHTLHLPIGMILIKHGEYVPNLKQEERGLTVAHFEGLSPSLLQPTAPEVRRRLLERAGGECPSDRIAKTAHLAEFQRNAVPGEEREPAVGVVGDEAGSHGEQHAAEGAEALNEGEPLPPFVESIVEFLSKTPQGEWSGRCCDLLPEVRPKENGIGEEKWPEVPQQLGMALRLHKKALERCGIELHFERRGKSSRRILTLRKRPG